MFDGDDEASVMVAGAKVAPLASAVRIWSRESLEPETSPMTGLTPS
jgi:hypothetical protein